MRELFCLTFYNRSNENDRGGFHIGLFRSPEEARAVELRYRKEVAGFKDHICEAEITAVPVRGIYSGEKCVYRYTGWNENKDFDAVDIVESDCYIDPAEAEADYKKAQSVSPRQEWALDHHVIGACDWQEGFT